MLIPSNDYDAMRINGMIIMTQKLFWQDSYLAECEVTVVKSEGNDVILDKTVFFAFSGGQQSDSGTINGVNVVEAKVQGDDIVYTLENNELKVGDNVVVKIDADKRDRIRRLHAAAHIVYYVFGEKTSIKKLIGSNVTEDKSRIDYDYPESIGEMLPPIEEEVNKIFSSDDKIKTYDDTEKPGRRVWEWFHNGPEAESIKMPCGGTHPRSTKEVGKVKLKRKNLGAGKERIEVTLS